MAALTMANRTASFIESESNGFRSRADVTVDATGGALVAGNIMGIVTATGDYEVYDDGAADGTENVAGILYEGIEAAEEKRTMIVRDCEVSLADLTYTGTEATVVAELAALGIITR